MAVEAADIVAAVVEFPEPGAAFSIPLLAALSNPAASSGAALIAMPSIEKGASI